MLRILFYVEPVSFRGDPAFLQPWLSWLARLIRAQSGQGGFSFAILSSPWLCRTLVELSPGVQSYPVSPADLLRPFGMDRVGYGQDLAAAKDDAPGNRPLAQALDAAVAAFKPNLIFSFSENRYIRACAPGVCSVFSELRPLPQTFGAGLFLDPASHQSGSLLVTQAARIRSLDIPALFEAETRARWEDGFCRRHRNHPETPDLFAWLRREAQGAPVAMLALQPPDWLTMEGLGERRAPDAVLMSWLDRLPAGWRAVATYHPSYALTRDLERTVAEQMPNLLLLPEAWRQGRSEWLLQGMDAVVTTSSTIGWAALLAGKRTVASARSNLGGFAGSDVAELNTASSLSAAERVRLAAFIRHRYSVVQDRFLDEPGYAAQIFLDIAAQGTDYFFTGFPDAFRRPATGRTTAVVHGSAFPIPGLSTPMLPISVPVRPALAVTPAG